MEKTQIIRSFLFPADQQASRAIGPRMGSFNDPSARPPTASAWCRRALPLAGNVSDVFAALRGLTNRIRIVTFIGTQMMLAGSLRQWTLHGNAVKRFFHQLLIMHIRAGDGDSNRHTAPVRQHRSLDAQLATIRWVFPGFFSPPSGALVIAPSKLCHCQSIPFNSSYSSRECSHNSSKTPSATHS